MQTYRTPDESFADLPGWSYAPHYAEIPAGDGDTLRVHWAEDGPADGEPVLLLHGEPSWSYLYRHMMPILAAAGLRAVAPDLVGFGRSDKPVERGVYTYQAHLDWLRATVDAIGLGEVTLVCQDWGGLLGLRWVGEEPQRFRRVVAANTFLPTGDGSPSEAFLNWRRFSQEVEDFAAGAIVAMGTTSDLAPEVVAAYDAPFPVEAAKAGARTFPALVPISPDDPAAPANRAAWEGLERYERPFLCAFSDRDPVTGGLDAALRERVRGAAGMPHTTIAGGGHFLQEDAGPELAKVVVDFVAST